MRVGRLLAVLVRPRLWTEAVRTGWAHRRRRWWVRVPFLPLLSQPHLSWRRATAYGSPDHPVEVTDLVRYLEWRRRLRRMG